LIIRGKYYSGLSRFKQFAPGRYFVERGSLTYRIEGGKHLGGSSKDWFLSGPYIDGDIQCSSIADALKVLDNL